MTPWKYCIILNLFILFIPEIGSKYATQILIHDLLEMYVNTAPPVENSYETVNVTYTTSPIMFDIDEKNEILSLTTADTLSWNDRLLTWDPALHGGVNEISLKPDKIWIPDLDIINPAREPSFERSHTLASVEHTGHILWFPMTRYKVQCFSNASYFPFDSQLCTIVIGSQVYNLFKMDINFANQAIPMYNLKHAIWKVHSIVHERVVIHCIGCNAPYITLKMDFRFTRDATLYVYTLLIPCLLLSTLTLILFLLPSDSPDKVTLGFGLFTAFFVLLLYLESILPASRSIPYLGIYLCFNLAIIALSTFLNALVVNLANSQVRSKVPKPLRGITFEFLAQVLCMPNIVKQNRARYLVSEENGLQLMSNNYCSLSNMKKKQVESDNDVIFDADLPESMSPRVDYQRLETDIADIKWFTSRCLQKITEADKEKHVISEWKHVAMVFNRLFFIFYFFLVTGSLGAYLFFAFFQ